MMEDERKLYPFRLCSLQDEYNWGTDEFKLADLGYRDSLVRDGWLAGNAISEVMDMYMDRMVGEEVFESCGRQFPVQVKHISVRGRMPLRVHPDSVTAEERYDFLGREKVWYVLRAGKDARLMLGFRDDSDAGQVYEKCLDNSVEDILNVVAPIPGHLYHIAPGTPHAAAGDIEIIEVSESSPLDFCMCGWGEAVSTDEFDPALNLVDALDFINYKAYRSDLAAEKADGLVERLFDCPQFTVSRLALGNPVRVHGGADCFMLYSCVKGSASVQIDVLGQTANFAFAAGDTILVPAECDDFILAPTAADTLLLATTVEVHEERDPYINQDAEPRLPEDSE